MCARRINEVVIRGVVYEVLACLKCKGPMLNDSRIDGMTCADCGKEEIYKKKEKEN